MGDHPPVETESPRNLQQHCLQLMHWKAYEEAASMLQDKDVLDLGCNIGYGTNALSRAARTIHGMDIIEGLIAQARKSHPALQFSVFDGATIPLPSGSIDCVVSFQVIEHIHDVRAYLAEITRVLRPSGMAIFTTPNARLRLDEGMRPWNRFHVREFSPAQLKEIASAAFPSVEVRGLFAVPALYEAERGRCSQARLIARLRDGHVSFPAIRAAIAYVLTRVVGESRESFQRYQTSDLYYRTGEIGEALDLMAVCRLQRA